MTPNENVQLAAEVRDEPRRNIRWTLCSCGTWRRERLRNCCPARLDLSSKARTRRNLRRLVKESGLPQGIFAQWIFGCDPVTMCSYLGKGEIPRTRAFQIDRIERVRFENGTLSIVMKGFVFNPRWSVRVRRLAFESETRSIMRNKSDVVRVYDALTQAGHKTDKSLL